MTTTNMWQRNTNGEWEINEASKNQTCSDGVAVKLSVVTSGPVNTFPSPFPVALRFKSQDADPQAIVLTEGELAGLIDALLDVLAVVRDAEAESAEAEAKAKAVPVEF